LLCDAYQNESRKPAYIPPAVPIISGASIKSPGANNNQIKLHTVPATVEIIIIRIILSVRKNFDKVALIITNIKPHIIVGIKYSKGINCADLIYWYFINTYEPPINVNIAKIVGDHFCFSFI
jgi:hypothetical protein